MIVKSNWSEKEHPAIIGFVVGSAESLLGEAAKIRLSIN